MTAPQPQAAPDLAAPSADDQAVIDAAIKAYDADPRFRCAYLANALKRARDRLVEQTQMLAACVTRIEEQEAALAAARAEAEKDKADAERYRWLRDVGDQTWTPIAKRAMP